MTSREKGASSRLGWRLSNLLLFTVTVVELMLLVRLTPSFTGIDWIYICQNLLVLALALARRVPVAEDHSFPASLAVAISMTYPYAQVICLDWGDGYIAWPDGGLVLVGFAAVLSLTSLVSLGKSFGLRPALRGLATKGPYRLVRHPMYLAYFVGDIGYQLDEWNFGTLALVLVGWASLIYRIRAEERILSRDAGWRTYASMVSCRLVPGVW